MAKEIILQMNETTDGVIETNPLHDAIYEALPPFLVDAESKDAKDHPIKRASLKMFLYGMFPWILDLQFGKDKSFEIQDTQPKGSDYIEWVMAFMLNLTLEMLSRRWVFDTKTVTDEETGKTRIYFTPVLSRTTETASAETGTTSTDR